MFKLKGHSECLDKVSCFIFVANPKHSRLVNILESISRSYYFIRKEVIRLVINLRMNMKMILILLNSTR